MKFTENKEIYNEFKYFKNIYTKINISDLIQFIGDSENNLVHIIFVRDSVFSNLYGSLQGETKFLNWLKEGNKFVQMEMKDIIQIAKCLKKNTIDIEIESDYFNYHFNDKDGNDINIKVLSNTGKEKDIIYKKLCEMNIAFKNSFDLQEEYLNSDILEVFLNNGEISKKRTKEKIIEIPLARVNSIIKDSPVKISFTDKDDIESRYVKILSNSDEFQLTLSEIFRTI